MPMMYRTCDIGPNDVRWVSLSSTRVSPIRDLVMDMEVIGMPFKVYLVKGNKFMILTSFDVNRCERIPLRLESEFPLRNQSA